MNVLPVVVRELRAQARQPFTFSLRMLGVIALLGGGVFFLSNFAFSPNRGGLLFGYLHLILVCSVWILVPLGAADCLSRERREGTLGLLFLTPLKPRDIVVAKGLTHGLRGMTLLIAVLPVLTIPVLIGGVSWQQAAASAIINFTAVCWALSAALVASAIARNGLRAMALAAFLAAAAFLIQTYLAGALLGSKMGGNFNRGYSSLDFHLIAGFAANGLHREAWTVWTGSLPTINARQLMSVILQSAVISMFVLLLGVLFAARRVRRSWQEEPPSLRVQQIERVFCQPVIWVSFLKRWMQWKLQRNPIGWLEQRRWSGRLVTWTWFAVIVSVQTTAMTDNTFFYGYAVWETFLAWLLTVSIAASAAGSFRRERETGVLELLLVSPLTSRQIINGRLLGLWGQFIPSIVLLLGVWAHFANILPNQPDNFQKIGSFAVTYLALPVIGLYFSVSCRHFIQAFLLTLAVVVIAPLLASGILHSSLHLVSRSVTSGQLDFRIVGPGAGAEVNAIRLLFAALFGVLLYRRLERRTFPLERSLA